MNQEVSFTVVRKKIAAPLKRFSFSVACCFQSFSLLLHLLDFTVLAETVRWSIDQYDSRGKLCFCPIMQRCCWLLVKHWSCYLWRTACEYYLVFSYLTVVVVAIVCPCSSLPLFVRYTGVFFALLFSLACQMMKTRMSRYSLHNFIVLQCLSNLFTVRMLRQTMNSHFLSCILWMVTHWGLAIL